MAIATVEVNQLERTQLEVPAHHYYMTPTLPIAYCKNYLVKMTMSEGYCSFRDH